MLIFCLGTAAELIKCYPVIRAASDLGLRWAILSTGQSPVNLKAQFDEFGLSGSGKYIPLLDMREDLRGGGQALRWFARLLLLSRTTLEKAIIKAEGDPSAPIRWIVHGDTLSTLGGSVIGRRLTNAKIVHLEAGLRSGVWWSPFPEEINRRLVSKIARIHYAPNADALQALKSEHVRGEIVLTQGNTQRDALAEAVRLPAVPSDWNSKDYVVANLHRFENLNHDERWKTLVDTVLAASKSHEVLFVMHPQTEGKLAQDPKARQRLENANVKLVPRLPFVQFSQLLKKSRYLITDGGGNQDDADVLGLPCLILRTHTESKTGLGKSGPCLLSRFDSNKIREFLDMPERYRTPSCMPQESASRSIALHLQASLSRKL